MPRKLNSFESCLLCGCSRLLELKGYEKDFLVTCAECGFVFCKPKPSEDELISFYNGYPVNNPLSPITLKRYEDLCLSLSKFRKTNNILDIGCGDGHFLDVAKRHGWNVFGTEFTEQAVKIGIEKGIAMFKGTLSSIEAADGFFDIITSFEVIEHINNPQEDARLISKFLRPGGMLYVTTPNFNSFSRTLMGSKWSVIAYPEHLCYYEKRTLRNLFNSHGFRTVSITTTGLSFDRFRNSSKKTSEVAPLPVDEIVRKKIEQNYFLSFAKWAVNFCLDLLSKGDALKASFIKR